MAPVIRIICGWCQTEMQAGVNPPSHGVCRPCMAKVLKEAARR